MWRSKIFPREDKVTIAGHNHADDDVVGWVSVLRRLNNPHVGLLPELEHLMDGKLPSRYLREAGDSGAKIQPGPDLPKQIRLAHTLSAFAYKTSDKTTVTRSNVEEWLDLKRVNLYRYLELQLKEDIDTVAGQLDYALTKSAFKSALKNFTPMEFMNCVLDLVPILIQAGRPDSIQHLFVNNQHKQIFDLFKLAGSATAALGQILDVRFDAGGSVKWNTKEIKTKSDADALKADITAPKKFLSTYKLYRDHVLPAIIVRQLDLGTPIVDFKTEIGDLVKRSTLPFYPAGALNERLSLSDFKTKAKEYDAQHAGRWGVFNSILVTELDRAATTAGSIFGVIDLYLAVEKIVSEPELNATSLKNVVVAGMSFVNDGLTQLAASSTMLTGEIGQGLKRLSTTLSKKILQRALFLFTIMDLVVEAKKVGSLNTKAEIVGNALILAGSVATVGASGLAILAELGLIAVAAGPVVALALIGAALGLIGWAVIALFHQSYPEQILRGSFFRKLPKDRDTALNLFKKGQDALDLRTGFFEEVNGIVTENLALQISYAVGLTRGFVPTARDVTEGGGLGDRAVEYKISRTPNSSTPPTKKADLDFISSVIVWDLDFDIFFHRKNTDQSRAIHNALFKKFQKKVILKKSRGVRPPLEFELETSFKNETLTFEPIGLVIKRWMAEQIVEAGGTAPSWLPPDQERLKIRERARAI